MACKECLLPLLAAVLVSIEKQPLPAAEPETRPAWTTSRFAGTPDPAPPYRVELAFPSLKFDHPVDLVDLPGTDRLMIAEQGGRLVTFSRMRDASTIDLAADLKAWNKEITSVYGITCDPGFAQNRYLYVCYVKGNDKPDGTYVSRFTMTSADPPALDLNTERVLIRWWSGGHNGGCLKFGPDGYLYISTGDGGGPDPPDPLQAGQDLSRLLSAILRIDVHAVEGERPYRVPSDNPFVGRDGARPEIWAHGFRNPWRMSFDRVRGELWVGDVGWQLWEMVYRVQRGGNYGWPIMEGPQTVLPGTRRGPTPILSPVYSHPHSEAASITGGFVYHGQRLPELRGAYIYGDFQSGKIWSLRADGDRKPIVRELASTPLQLVSFGEDLRGELYLIDYGRSQQIFELVPQADSGQNLGFPRRLSETGLFRSVAKQEPEAGVLPYEINATHWADGTASHRWMAVPGTDPVRVDGENWLFPDGSVLVKTIRRQHGLGNEKRWQNLETQVLHREAGTWRPYAYRWNEAQDDAELVAGHGESFSVSEPGNTWSHRIVSRAECQLCHNPWVEKKTTIHGIQSASPLAVSLAQWDRPATGNAASENQLSRFRHQGWLTGTVEPGTVARLADPRDESIDLDPRARTYLHVNCAHCHQRHAGGTTTIDLSFGTPLSKVQAVDVRPVQGAFGLSQARIIAPGDPMGSVLHYRLAKSGGGRMPRLGTEEIDPQGVRLIRRWIAQMSSSSESAGGAGVRELAEPLDRIESDSELRSAVESLLSTTRGAVALRIALDDQVVSARTRAVIVDRGATHSQAEVRDLFEHLLPVGQRVQRLGTQIDRAALLALPADAERGRQLFFREGAASCQACHRVQGQGGTLGPDLSRIGGKYPIEELLVHLLEPSRRIDPEFQTYTLETRDGRVFTGLVIERTPERVALRTAQVARLELPLSEVEQLTPQQVSLMPELLLRDMTPQQAADLLAYLASKK